MWKSSQNGFDSLRWVTVSHFWTGCHAIRSRKSFCADVITDHPYNNVPENVFKKLGVNLHRRPDHPLGILKDAIYSYFDQHYPGTYQKFDDLYPVVSTKAVSRLSKLVLTDDDIGWLCLHPSEIELPKVLLSKAWTRKKS